MTALTRRRFLAISAATAALPAHASTVPTATWRGIALGAPASLQLVGLEQSQAQPIFSAVEAELSRLELIFSLYKEGSELRRLNANGILRNPSSDLLEVLSLAGSIHETTGGAFDPSIQPLWLATAQGMNPSGQPQSSNWQYLSFDSRQIKFNTPHNNDMALTLNGIAQGAVTDRIASLLRGFGLRDVLVDMGEIAASGTSSDGKPWQVGVADPTDQVVNRVRLSNRAMATSAPDMPDLSGRARRHIMPPTPAHQIRQFLVSVSAPTAAIADGLSTACCLLNNAEIERALAQFPGAQIEALRTIT